MIYFPCAMNELFQYVLKRGNCSDQLEQRKKKRQKRARDERKREKKIAEVELRQMGRHATPRLRLDSFHHFPQCGISEEDIPPPLPR